MNFLAPRIAQDIGVAMARVATRFYVFSMLLVASTIYLPHKGMTEPNGLIVLAALSVGMIVFLALFPWDKHETRVFTLSYLFSSCALLALLVYFTGGTASSYSILFFLIILFSYFYNLREMFTITTVVALFYLFPHLYDTPEPYQFTVSAVTVLFFYLGTYILYDVTVFVLKKNQVLQELNAELTALYSLSSGLMKDLEAGSLPDSLSENLKDHLPSTYCIVMLLDNDLNLTMRIACPIRALTWEPLIGMTYAPDQLTSVRPVLETRQPLLFRLEHDVVDYDLRKILTINTCSALIVPIRNATDNMGVMIFGEERQWDRAPFTQEKMQLAVAISKQVATGLTMWWCYERLTEAQRELQLSHDKVIKAERLATLGEVTRAVEHEINNPLSVIVNWSEIYREDETIDPALRKKFQIIYDMSMRIIAVIKKLSELKDAKSIEFMKGQNMTDID